MNKKIIYTLTMATLAVLLSISFASASTNPNPNITVSKPILFPSENQQLTVTTSTGGFGVLFVVQPASGSTWSNFLNSQPALKALLNSLPKNVQADISSKVGNNIVSFTLITMKSGTTKTQTFPTDFTGINGKPGTAMQGTYKVLFIFVSVSGQKTTCQPIVEKDFACGSFFVAPEYPLGTIMAITAPIASFAGFKLYKKHTTTH